MSAIYPILLVSGQGRNKMFNIELLLNSLAEISVDMKEKHICWINANLTGPNTRMGQSQGVMLSERSPIRQNPLVHVSSTSTCISLFVLIRFYRNRSENELIRFWPLYDVITIVWLV